ncbi:hypothetical protein DIPPA_16325 [Diplonema papillatum]|nr:hypothetical protein DIPPA_16325 [Diplonema papillatum]
MASDVASARFEVWKDFYSDRFFGRRDTPLRPGSAARFPSVWTGVGTTRASRPMTCHGRADSGRPATGTRQKVSALSGSPADGKAAPGVDEVKRVSVLHYGHSYFPSPLEAKAAAVTAPAVPAAPEAVRAAGDEAFLARIVARAQQIGGARKLRGAPGVHDAFIGEWMAWVDRRMAQEPAAPAAAGGAAVDTTRADIISEMFHRDARDEEQDSFTQFLLAARDKHHRPNTTDDSTPWQLPGAMSSMDEVNTGLHELGLFKAAILKLVEGNEALVRLVGLVAERYERGVKETIASVEVSDSAITRGLVSTLQGEVLRLSAKLKATEDDVRLSEANQLLKQANDAYHDECLLLKRQVQDLHGLLQATLHDMFLFSRETQDSLDGPEAGQPRGVDGELSFAFPTTPAGGQPREEWVADGNGGEPSADFFVTGLQRVRAELAALRRAVDEARGEAANYLRESNEQQRDVNAAMGKCNELSQMVRGLKVALKDVRAELAASRRAKEALETEAREHRVIEVERDMLRARLQLAEAECGSAQRLIAAFTHKTKAVAEVAQYVTGVEEKGPSFFFSRGTEPHVPPHLRAPPGKIKNKTLSSQAAANAVAEILDEYLAIPASTSSASLDASTLDVSASFNPGPLHGSSSSLNSKSAVPASPVLPVSYPPGANWMQCCLVSYAARQTCTVPEFVYSLLHVVERDRDTRKSADSDFFLGLLKGEYPPDLPFAAQMAISALQEAVKKALKGGSTKVTPENFAKAVRASVTRSAPLVARLLLAAAVDRSWEERDIDADLTVYPSLLDAVKLAVRDLGRRAWIGVAAKVLDLVAHERDKRAPVSAIKLAIQQALPQLPSAEVDSLLVSCVDTLDESEAAEATASVTEALASGPPGKQAAAKRRPNPSSRAPAPKPLPAIQRAACAFVGMLNDGRQLPDMDETVSVEAFARALRTGRFVDWRGLAKTT